MTSREQFEHVDPARRSLMARIKGTNSQPEILVRRLIHSLGYRFRLHRRDMPGTPDIVLPGRKKVVFVHGCFWHRHRDCPRTTTPTTRREYWENKFTANVERDARQVRALEVLGWKVLVVWECETRQVEALKRRLTDFLKE